MRTKLFVAAMVSMAMIACTPAGPSDVTRFSANRISPTPGSVIDPSVGATIEIVGPLSVQEGVYYTMVYVRDDGAVFLPGEWGPSSGNSSWDEYPFSQDVAYNGHVTEERFAQFCAGRTVTEASFITSNTSILVHSALNSSSVYTFFDFRWGIVNYRVDIPLNYTCR